MNIMVIDDHEPIARMIGLYYESMGHYTETYADPRKAHSALSSKLYDVIITDLMMACCNGYHIHRQAKSTANRNARIIAISALDAMYESYKHGFDGFIQKPITLDQLQAII